MPKRVIFGSVLFLASLALVGAGCGGGEFEEGEMPSGQSGAEQKDIYKGISTVTFKQDTNQAGFQETTHFMLRNLDSQNPDIRWEREFASYGVGGSEIIILLGEEQKGWRYSQTEGPGWKTLKESSETNFDQEWDYLSHIEYVLGNMIKDGQVLKAEYQVGPTIKAYDLEIDKELSDSLFRPEQ